MRNTLRATAEAAGFALHEHDPQLPGFYGVGDRYFILALDAGDTWALYNRLTTQRLVAGCGVAELGAVLKLLDPTHFMYAAD